MSRVTSEAAIGEEEPRLVLTAGARAAESLLLATLDPLLDAAAADPALLARPAVIVVPSASLRRHLAARLVAHRGRSVAGVSVVPVLTLARVVVERCGEVVPGGEALFPVLVQRAARREGSLRSGLDPLQDGYAPLAGTVRDLLDAGFEPALAEALEERLAELGAGRRDPEVDRALAVVRVAVAVHDAMAEAGLGTDAALLRRAAALLAADPERALPARALFVHGFAEATGLTADLLEALVRHCGASVVLDQPPDPAEPGRPDLGVAFTARLRERLEGVAGRATTADEATVPPAETELVEADGSFGEARAAAVRIRALLDAGVRPERIGVAARELGTLQHAIAQQFGRLAIPFSAPGAPGLAGPATRRLAALLELLADGEAASLDAWMAVRGGARDDSDLRLALRAAGAVRLGDVAGLDVAALAAGGDSVSLPVRTGVTTVEDGDGEVRVRPRRKLAARRLEAAVGEAAALCAALRPGAGSVQPSRHLAWLRELIDRHLGWQPGDPGAGAVTDQLEALARELPAGERLERDEFVTLLRRPLGEAGREPLGGAGGGVQVLGAMDARGTTFEHLLILGVNRDVFPRVAREDPLLPDRVRRALRVVLPELPLKAGGADEERYLFAQLCSSATRVVVSWQASDDDGKPRPPSPLVERLRLARGGELPRAAGEGGVGERLRPAHEHAVLAGLHGSRSDFAAALEVALGPRPTAGELAAGRTAVLDEADPDFRSPAGRARSRQPGPYHGLVGAVRSAGEARSALHVTRLEEVAACGWKVFLERLLGLEPAPDPASELPTVTPLMVGELVHAVLERIVHEARPDLPTRLDEAAAATAVQVPWPEAGRLDELVSDEAARVARGAGFGLPGLGALLALLARPYLDLAGRLDWPSGGGPAVLGVEVEGELKVRDGGGNEWPVGFRADRVDRDPTTGAIRLTDYKIGRPPYHWKRESTRRDHLLGDVASGRRLQALAYALGTPGPAVGRYLFLGPAEDEAVERVVGLAGDDDEATASFATVVAAVLDAWRGGAFLPRVVDEQGVTPRLCEYCEVRQACLLDDSGARQRLLRWLAAREAAGVEPVAAARAWWALASRDREEEE
jgi:hypothetical protein